MIFTRVDTWAQEADLKPYHVEKVTLPPEDFQKKILRVTSDHGNEYGIRLEDGEVLKDGAIFFIDSHNVLMVCQKSQNYLEVIPRDMEEMGEVAHLLGNTHRPVVIENNRIYLEVDPVAIKHLEKHHVNYNIRDIKLKKVLKHVDLSHVH